jgi:hypothetical protein
MPLTLEQLRQQVKQQNPKWYETFIAKPMRAANVAEFFQWADLNGCGTDDITESTCPKCGGPSYDIKTGEFDCPKCKRLVLREAKKPQFVKPKPRKIVW